MTPSAPPTVSPVPRTLTLEAVEALALHALTAAGATPQQAQPVARAVRAAEADGIRSHGLPYVPIYCEHLRCGKVVGTAVPVLARPRPGAVTVDAASGFAHPAIALGVPALVEAAQAQGCAAMTLVNSYNCGVLGHHVERLAEAGLVALGFTNAPASIAPVGGTTPVIGTNPVALAVPGSAGDGAPAFLIDQSASVVAKSEVMVHAKSGTPIPDHWAKDAAGRPTTDAQAALDGGSMAPAGGQKGFGMGLIVETLAAALSGATLGRDASPFSGPKGGPPRTGQCFIALDPAAFGGLDSFRQRIESLCAAITDQEGTRLPGARRAANRARSAAEGVTVDAALLDRIEAIG